jgi:acyl carrier protein
VAGADSAIGHFVTNVPVRVRVNADDSFAAVASRIQSSIASVATHQWTPLTEIAASAELPWNARLFASLFVFQNYRTSEQPLRFAGAEVLELTTPVRTAYPLTLIVEPGSQTRITCSVQPRLTSSKDLDDLLERLRAVLARICADPNAAVAEIVPPRERVARPEIAVRRAAIASRPLTSAETIVAEIWREALGREASATDNFFDLGGHSLLMLQVHRRLCSRLDREIPIVTLFQHPTIESLARYLSGSEIEKPASAVQDRASKARAAMARQAQKLRNR